MRTLTLFILIGFPALGFADFFNTGFEPINFTGKSHKLLISSDLSPKESIELMDNFSQSVVYSLANDQIINGSGTSYSQYSTQKEGYFTRMLNTLSYHDLYFTSKMHRFLEENLENGEKRHFSLVFAPLSNAYGETLPPYQLPVSTDALSVLFPVLDFFVKGIPENAYEIKDSYPQYKATVFSMKIRQALAEYYYSLVAKAAIGLADQSQRLSAMFALFLPMASQFNFYVEKKNEGEFTAKSRIDLYFPAIAQLKDLELGSEYRFWDPESLYREFNNKIKTSVAILDGISYSASEDRDRFPLMRVRVTKDYNNIHEKEMQLTFGIQGGDEDGELISINKGNLSDHLNIFGRIQLKGLSENPVFKVFPKEKREEILSYIDGFKLQVGIHKVGLLLKREAGSDDFKASFGEDEGFKVHFLPEKSEFAYRITKYIQSEGIDERWKVHTHLKKMGFDCEKQAESKEYLCSKYFDDVKSFQDSLAKTLFNKLAERALKNQIPVIHKMADEEIAKIVEKLVSQVQGAKAAIMGALKAMDSIDGEQSTTATESN